MLAQGSGPKGKAPRREADWFLAASCTFSFCSTLKNVSGGCTHCLQYLQPEEEKAPPDSVSEGVTISSLPVSNPLLLQFTTLQNILFAVPALIPDYHTRTAGTEGEREKLLGGRNSLACHKSPGSDEKSD